MKTVAALAGAIAMVAASFVIRDRFIEDDRPSLARGDLELVCTTELPDAACAGGTEVALDAVLEGEVPEAWLTAGPWPAALEADATGFDEIEVVASTSLVVVAKQGVLDACTADPTWACISRSIVEGTSVGAPSRATGVRTLARAALLGGVLGTTEFDRNYALDQPDASSTMTTIEQSIESARRRQLDSLRLLLTTRVDAAFITTAADAASVQIAGFEVITPTPVVRVEATIGVRGGQLPDGLGPAFRDAGWQVPPETGADDGLPSPGVVLALREEV